ncbi:hypothetical protein LCGC14_0990200 [marine sediment metagenome]|uniref:Uncharacterized protein n=1 Tax=marine sediment metagenome TaxID=412755 RepID=A0A0F9RCL7_9ZZZZ
MTEEQSQARAQFEALSEGIRNKKIGIAVNAASFAYTGFTVGGPIGAGVGAALGTLIGLWGMKSYRERVYAELEAAGMISRPRTRYRSIWDRYISEEPGFLRYPGGEAVGYAVIEVLTDQYPTMSEQEISAEAYAIVKVFHQFRRSNPDVPIEIAAEVILLMNGIRRNPQTGNYEPFTLEFPEEPPPVEQPPAAEPLSETKIAWGLAAAALAILAFRSRK